MHKKYLIYQLRGRPNIKMQYEILIYFKFSSPYYDLCPSPIQSMDCSLESYFFNILNLTFSKIGTLFALSLIMGSTPWTDPKIVK